MYSSEVCHNCTRESCKNYPEENKYLEEEELQDELETQNVDSEEEDECISDSASDTQ